MSAPEFATPIPIATLFDLHEQVAVVTGAGSGIGQACAARLAQVGARVLCADIDLDAATATVDGLRAAGGDAAPIAGDVRVAADVERMAARAVELWGRVDVAVNGAGVFPPSPVLDTPAELWDDVHDINVKGTFLTSQACARHMAAGGRGGRIVNLASKSAYQPSVGLVHYSSTKAAVVGMTKGLALELAPHRIRVNAIAPGGVNTPGARTAAERMIVEQPRSADDIRAAHAGRCPLGRQAEADEMARIALFLVSDASSYITGVTILADGGYLLS